MENPGLGWNDNKFREQLLAPLAQVKVFPTETTFGRVGRKNASVGKNQKKIAPHCGAICTDMS